MRCFLYFIMLLMGFEMLLLKLFSFIKVLNEAFVEKIYL